MYASRLLIGAAAAILIEGALAPAAAMAETLTLRTAVATALAKNPNIQVAREKLNELDQDVKLAVSQFFPTVTLPAVAETKKDPITNPLALFGGQDYNFYSVGIQATQPLFAGGLLTGGLKYAHSSRTMSEMDALIAERDLTTSVISAFYQVLLNQRNIATYTSNIEVQERLLVTTQHRARIGRSQQLDVLQIKTQLALLRPKLAQAQNALQISASQLANLLADRQASEISVSGTLDPVPWAPVEEKLKGEKYRILEIEKIDAQLDQLEGTRSITLAKHWPLLSGIANWSRSNYSKSDLLTPDATGWVVGLQLSIPVFSGLSSFHERSVLTSQELQIETNRTKTLDTTSLAQVQSKKNLDTEIDLIDATRKAFDLGEASLHEAERQYRLSTIDYVQYLNSQQNLLQAALTYDQAKYDYINAMSAYFTSWGFPIKDLVDILDPKKGG